MTASYRPPQPSLCDTCKNCCSYVVRRADDPQSGQRCRVCIVTAERFAPDQEVIECSFYVPLGEGGPRHYS